MRDGISPWSKALLLIVAALFILAPTDGARADKDTACEAYALGVMRQIKDAEKHDWCRTRGFFAGDRWRNDFHFHFQACAQRYEPATNAHRAFTQGEKQARERELSLCVDKEAKGQESDGGKSKKKNKGKKDLPELTECTVLNPGSGGGCKSGLKWVCEKMKGGRKCCGCVPDKNAATPATPKMEEQPCYGLCASKCGGPTEEARNACVLNCLETTNCSPH